MLVCLTAARTFAPIAHLTREWTRNCDGGHLRKARARSTGSYDARGAAHESPHRNRQRLLDRPLHPLPTKLGDPPQCQSSTTFGPALTL